MPRKKKTDEEILSQTDTSLDLTETEPSYEARESAETESLEADTTTAEAAAEEVSEAAPSEQAEAPAEESQEPAVEKTAPKKRRRPRRKKAIAKKAKKKEEKIEPVVAEPIADVAESTPEVDAAETSPTQVREDVTIAVEGVRHTMDTMARQWNLVKEISGGVVQNLERVNGLLHEIPAQAPVEPVAPAPRNSYVTKIAVGFSGFALLLSAISLVLSQNARDKALERFVVASRPQETAAIASSKSAAPVVPAAPAKSVLRIEDAPVVHSTTAPEIAAKARPVVAPRRPLISHKKANVWAPSHARKSVTVAPQIQKKSNLPVIKESHFPQN